MNLMKAIKEGDEKLACTMVYSVADIRKLDHMMWRATEARMEILTMIFILKGASSEGALCAAAEEDKATGKKPCVTIMRMLMEAGVGDFEEKGALTKLLMEDASTIIPRPQEHYDALRLVIKMKPSIVNASLSDHGQGFPLHCVDDRKSMDLLVWAGADLGLCDGGGNTPLHDQLRRDPSPEMVQGFVDYGADLNAINSGGRTPLVELCRWNDHPSRIIVDILLRGGADETLGKRRAVEYVNLDVNPLTHKLLVNAPMDRRWRRRGLLVVCIARHGQGFLVVQPVVVSLYNRNDWGHVARRLVEIGTDAGLHGIFRTIVGFL